MFFSWNEMVMQSVLEIEWGSVIGVCVWVFRVYQDDLEWLFLQYSVAKFSGC